MSWERLGASLGIPFLEAFLCGFSGPAPPQKGGGGIGGATSGGMVHLARISVRNMWENTHWAKVVLSRAVRRGGLLRGKVSQGSTSPLKPCVKG